MNLRTFLAPRAHSAASLARGTLLISLTTTVFSMSALAQDTTKPAATKPTTKATNATPAANSSFEATITVDEALVRCDASAESGYPFGTLAKGQVVTVVDSVPGWVRVQTSGPAFEGWGGFITQLPTMKLSDDGKSLSFTSTATIVAPNGNEGFLPERSWKAIGFMVPGDTIAVIDTIKGERETYFAVPLSARTSGWIAASAISRNAAPATTTTTAPTTTTTGTDNTTDATAPKSTATGTETGTTGTTTTTEGTNAAKKPTEASTEPKTVKKPKAPAEPKAPTAASKTLDEYKALEQKWNGLAKDTCAMADLQELQVSYANLSRNGEALTPTRQAAKLRSIHITQLIELRDMQEHAKKIAARGEDKAREVQAIEEWLRARQQYTAVGVLNASVVYDGERLPRLYRLQDPTSGLTVAYLTEDPDLKLSSMLGLVVGVKGDKKFDESLRRDIITPTSMTVLRSDKETAIASPEKTEGADSGDESGK